MKFAVVVFCFSVVFSTIQGGSISPAHQVKEIAQSMKASNALAKDEVSRAFLELHSALDQHQRTRRSIEDKFVSLSNQISEACGEEIINRIDGLKADAAQNFDKCSSGTIFRAVGDCVRIVTVASELVTNVFSTLDILTHNFDGCHQNSTMGTALCVTEGLVVAGVDTYSTYKSISSVATDINSLSADVTRIIHVCESNSDLFVKEAYKLISSC